MRESVGRGIVVSVDEKDSNRIVVVPINLLPNVEGEASSPGGGQIQSNKTVEALAITSNPYLIKQYRVGIGEDVRLYRDVGHDGETYYWAPYENFAGRKDTVLNISYPAKVKADDVETVDNTYRLSFDTEKGEFLVTTGKALKEKVVYRLAVSFKEGVLQFITDSGDELTWDNVSRIFSLVSKEATLEMDKVTVTKDLVVGNDMQVGGNVTIGKNMKVGGAVNVVGGVTANSLTAVTGTITGAFTVGGLLNVAGAVNVVGVVTAAKGVFSSGPYT